MSDPGDKPVRIIVSGRDFNSVCRLLNMITRLERGSCPSALDQAEALDLYRKLRRSVP